MKVNHTDLSTRDQGGHQASNASIGNVVIFDKIVHDFGKSDDVPILLIKLIFNT